MAWLKKNAIYLCCVAVFGIAFALIGFDKEITDTLHDSTRPMDAGLQLLTFLGDGRVLMPGCILLWLALHAAKKPGSKLPLLALASFAVSGTVTQVLKSVIGRPRPYLTLDSRYAHVPLEIFHGFTLNHDFASFPSGHATAVFSIAWFTFRLAGKKWQRNLVLTLAVLVGLTRVALWKHYMADTIAGAAIGVFFSEAAIELLNTKRVATQKRKTSPQNLDAR